MALSRVPGIRCAVPLHAPGSAWSGRRSLAYAHGGRTRRGVRLNALRLPEIAAAEPGPAPPKIGLWVAVLDRAISDAGSQGKGPSKGRDQARRWLTQPSFGLHQILVLINIEPDWWHAE